MYRLLTEVKARMGRVNEKNRESDKKHEIDLPLSVKSIMKRFDAVKDGQVQIPNAYKNEVPYRDS